MTTTIFWDALYAFTRSGWRLFARVSVSRGSVFIELTGPVVRASKLHAGMVRIARGASASPRTPQLH
jgi:hypothetical protein